MNILLIDNSVAFTGAFKCALNEAELLSTQHKFVFIIPSNSNTHTYLEEKGIKYYRVNMLEIHKSLSILFYPILLIINTFKIKSIIRKERIDVIQCNDFYNLLGVMAKLSGFKGKLITYVRFVPAVIPSILRKIWLTLGEKYSHRIIAVSDTVLKQLPKASNIIRLYDPVYLTEKLSESQSNSDEVKILYLSNYIQGKGQDFALEAFSRAYAKDGRLRLKFVGGDMGLAKNKEFKKVLQEKIQQLSLTDVVHFAEFNPDIEKEIKSADILLNFSAAESLSMTCLEAAYYGTAVIATRCGGPEEVIRHNETGILVPVADIDEMEKAILTLGNDKLRRIAYTTAGKEYVRKKFNKETFISRFNDMLNNH